MGNEVQSQVSEILNNIDEFDLSIGNGLNIQENQSRPGSHCLFIGLGGTGIHALMRLKRLVSQKYYSWNNEFTFLGIDTTGNVVIPEPKKNYMKLSTNEMMALSTDHIKVFLEGKQQPDAIKAFLNSSVTHSGSEAGQKRQVGRTLLFKNITEIDRILENALSKLKGGGNSTGQVYIFAGVGGGTGSGMVLDIAYLMRQKIKNSGFDANIYGLLFLPDVNEANPNLTTGNIIRDLYLNSYAAFKEIDYWMTSFERGDKFECTYAPGIEVNTLTPNDLPFDYIYPVMATNSKGIAIKKGYDSAISVAAEVICAIVSYKIDRKNTHHGDPIASARTAMGNAVNTTSMKYHQNHSKDFALFTNSFKNVSIGASALKMPFSEITTYLLGKIVGEIKEPPRALDDKIFESKVEEFCKRYDKEKFPKSAGIAIDVIENDIKLELKKFKVNLSDDFNLEDVISYSDNGNYNRFEKALNEYVANVNSRIDEAALNVRKEIIARLISLDGKLSDGLMPTFFSSVEEGPFFLKDFLFDDTYGLLNKFDKFKRDVVERISRIDNREPEMERECQTEKASAAVAVGILRKSCIRYYKEALLSYYQNKVNRIIYCKMLDLYSELKTELFNKCAVVANYSIAIIKKVKEVVAINNSYYNPQGAINPDRSEYSWNLYETDEIPALIDGELRGNYGDEYSKRLTECSRNLLSDLYKKVYDELLKTGSSSWNVTSLTEKMFVANDFFGKFVTDKKNLYEMFYYQPTDDGNRTWIPKTMGYYIEKKACAESMSISEFLASKIKNLKNNANILFYRTADSVTTDGLSNYISYPDEGTDISKTEEPLPKDSFINALNIIGGEQISPALGVAKDSIICIALQGGTPLFESISLGVRGQEIYDSMLHEIRGETVHLVSVNKHNSTKYLSKYYDWRKLPTFIPKHRLEAAKRVKYEQKEHDLKKAFESYMARNLIWLNSDERRLEYNYFTVKDFDMNGEYTIHKKKPAKLVLENLPIIGNGYNVSFNSSVKVIEDYFAKLKTLKEYLTFIKPVDTTTLIDEYGTRILYGGDESKRKSFACSDRFQAEGHELDEGIDYFCRSLNVQRDLEATSDFLDELETEIVRVQKIMGRYENIDEICDVFIKGFICGFFAFSSNIKIAYYPDLTNLSDKIEIGNLNEPLILNQLIEGLQKLMKDTGDEQRFSTSSNTITEWKKIFAQKFDVMCETSALDLNVFNHLNVILGQQANGISSGLLPELSDYSELVRNLFEKKIKFYHNRCEEVIRMGTSGRLSTV